MTYADEPADRTAADLHRMLLRLAGRLPDELITLARGWLAGGEATTAGRAVAAAALTGYVVVTAADAGLLARELAASGDRPGDFRIGPEAPLVHGFSPVGPAFPDRADLPYSLDLTRRPWPAAAGPDPVDRAAIGAVAGTRSRGLWRCWRYPARDVAWPPPRRVYLLLVAEDVDPVAVTAAVQTALAAAGEPSPQVECYSRAGELSGYQQAALGYSALLWSDRPAVDVRTACVFDRITADGTPAFDERHPTLDGERKALVHGYLTAGVPLLISNEYSADVVEPARGDVVPVTVRTDGRWVWPDACAYYLAEHSLAPDPALLADITAAGHRRPEVDDVDLHRALTQLYARSSAASTRETGQP